MTDFFQRHLTTPTMVITSDDGVRQHYVTVSRYVWAIVISFFTGAAAVIVFLALGVIVGSLS